jgi:membrane fusion protein (multidrug efflux system)
MKIYFDRSWVMASVSVLPLLVGADANAQDAANTPLVASVRVANAVERDLRPTISFTGRVEAVDKVELRARVEGVLEQRLFKEGDDVKEGAPLFVIEKGTYEANVEQATGALQSGRAQLALADIEVQRQMTLVAKSAAAQSALDFALAKQGDSRGQLVQLQATLKKDELQLSYTDIRSPISGRISRSRYSIGNYLNNASEGLATIVSQDPVYVTFSVTQREILAIRKKQSGKTNEANAIVYAQLADGSNYPHPGKISFVDVKVNPGTDAVLLRASFPNQDRLLTDGQLVNVLVEGAKSEPSLTVPQSAVQADQSGTFVLVVGKDNKIEVRPIEIGAATGLDLAVTKGLTTNDSVVIEGIQKVRPGQVVQPVEAESGL